MINQFVSVFSRCTPKVETNYSSGRATKVCIVSKMSCPTPDKFFPTVKTPMLPADCLKGKIAFVTGGGTGLGRAMATIFASLGAQVAIASRRKELLEKTAAEISESTGGTVKAIQLNVKSAEEVARAADECEAQLGTPTIIVNNAAGNFISPTERLSPNAFKTVIDIVLTGTAYVTLEFAKRARAQGKPATFLSITTPYARTGSAFVTPSACAKAGVENLNRSLAGEWAKYGMRFNCIAPGPIYTEGAFSRLESGDMGDDAMKYIGAGRFGDTTELANLAAYLVSDYSSWMNGAVIDFDGAQTPLMSGLFNGLHKVKPEQWDNIEKMIREKSGKSKM